MRRLLPLTLAALATLIGVSAAPVRAQDTAPALKVSAGDLVFDDVALGATSKQTVTVTNAGGGTLALGTPAVGGGDAKDFAVSASSCTAAQLTAGQTCTVEVAFKPTTASTRVSHLRIPVVGLPCTTYVTLAGTGAGSTSGGHPDKHSGFTTSCATTGGGTTTTTTTTTTPAPVVVSNGGVLGTSESGNAVCQSKRKIRIHVRAPKGKAFKRGTMKITTKGRTFSPKRITKGKRAGQYYADLSFKGLKVGRYKVSIAAKLTNGKSFKASRHFVTCISGKTPKS